MPLNTRLIKITILPILIAGLIACNPFNDFGVALSQLGSPSLTNITQLAGKQQSQDKKVYIQGKVINQAPFLDNGAYQVQDQTGTIWILTNNKLPTQGKEILVEAQLEYQSIPVSGQEMGELYLVEVKQLDPKNSQIRPTQPVEKPNVRPTVETPSVKPTKPLNDLLLPHKSNQK